MSLARRNWSVPTALRASTLRPLSRLLSSIGVRASFLHLSTVIAETLTVDRDDTSLGHCVTNAHGNLSPVTRQSMNADRHKHCKKYGYAFESMESPSRFELTKAEAQSTEETELHEVKATPPMSSVATSTVPQPGSIPCGNGGCKSWTSRDDSRLESPWHFLKTVFLVSVIVALIVWVIIFAFLTQYQIL